MTDISNRFFGFALAAILILQIFAGLWHIGDSFIDGRYHYNWGPPFWLMHAQTINEVGLPATYFGIKDYPSHPQLLGPIIALWTSSFGYSEASIRALALSLTVLATLFLTLATRSFIGNKRALLFSVFLASLPIIYIYGKKLDQEVLLLVFLGIHLWGIGLFEKSKKIALTLVTVGSLGMMLSDWSGAVFAFATALGAVVAWGWRERKLDIISLSSFSFVASGIGLLLFLFQSYLQSAANSVNEFINGYINLWKYRAGANTDNFSFFSWPVNQIKFILVNFNLLVFFAGCFGLLSRLRNKIKEKDQKLWELSVFVTAIFLGSITYMLVVPQASAIHVYYQYYWSIPIALGLVFVVESIASKFKTKNRDGAFIMCALLTFAITVGTTMYQYNQLLFVNSWGNETDIKLIESIREFPSEETIYTANDNPLALSWFQNPNIRYYAGREIKGYLFSEAIPLPDYFILPQFFADDVTAFINSGEGYGNDVSATKERCSDNLCLIKTRINK